MPTSSRFTRSGAQLLHGSFIHVRRGLPLPNKGRYSFTQNADRFEDGEGTWQEAIILNNPLPKPPFNIWRDIGFVREIEARNPSS